MDLKEEQAIGGDPKVHWYYISKARAIKSLIGQEPVGSLLDVGAGSGVFSRILVEDGIAQEAVCVDPNYDDEWLEAHRSDCLVFKRSVNIVDAPLVLMIDVIEHVDDDIGLIAEYSSRAKEGARFLISVPAFNFLWSSHDDFLEHRRRYTLDMLTAAVEAAGLEVVSTRYFFGMLFPAVAALRLADRALNGDRAATKSALKSVPNWLNNTLVAIHDVERAALFPMNKLAGVTAFCLARKPAPVAKNVAAA